MVFISYEAFKLLWVAALMRLKSMVVFMELMRGGTSRSSYKDQEQEIE